MHLWPDQRVDVMSSTYHPHACTASDNDLGGLDGSHRSKQECAAPGPFDVVDTAIGSRKPCPVRSNSNLLDSQESGRVDDSVSVGINSAGSVKAPDVVIGASNNLLHRAARDLFPGRIEKVVMVNLSSAIHSPRTSGACRDLRERTS